MIPGAVERVFPHPGHVHLYKVFRLEFDEVDACKDNGNDQFFCCRLLSNVYNSMGSGKRRNTREVGIAGTNTKQTATRDGHGVHMQHMQFEGVKLLVDNKTSIGLTLARNISGPS